MQTNIHRKSIKLILKLKRWILCELCPFVFFAGTDKPLTYTRSHSAIFFSPILPKNLLLISNMAHLTIEVFACFYFACHYNLRSPIVSFFRFLSFFFLCILSYLKPWGTLTVDSGWAFNDFSYRVRYHGWLVVLRGKLSHVARWGMIAFCRRKGALKNISRSICKFSERQTCVRVSSRTSAPVSAVFSTLWMSSIYGWWSEFKDSYSDALSSFV